MKTGVRKPESGDRKINSGVKRQEKGKRRPNSEKMKTETDIK